MNKMIAFVALVLSCASAQAAERTLVAELTRFHLDPQVEERNKVESGQIELNLGKAKKSARLTLWRAFRCPPGRFCAQMMPGPLLVELPIVSIETDSCGSVLYTAEIDRRPVDGSFQRLRIADNSRNRCPTFVALPDTGVVYETETPRTVEREVLKTRSQFDGERLRSSDF